MIGYTPPIQDPNTVTVINPNTNEVLGTIA